MGTLEFYQAEHERLTFEAYTSNDPVLADKLNNLQRLIAGSTLVKLCIEKSNSMAAKTLFEGSMNSRSDYLGGSTLTRDQVIANREHHVMQPIDVDFSAVGLKDALCLGGSIERIGALTKIGQLGETEKLNARLIELSTDV
jgi:hypothetical protein